MECAIRPLKSQAFIVSHPRFAKDSSLSRHIVPGPDDHTWRWFSSWVLGARKLVDGTGQASVPSKTVLELDLDLDLVPSLAQRNRLLHYDVAIRLV